MKQCMATILCHNNKLTSVACAFWGSNKFVPFAPLLSFYLQSGWLSSSSFNEALRWRYTGNPSNRKPYEVKP